MLLKSVPRHAKSLRRGTGPIRGLSREGLRTTALLTAAAVHARRLAGPHCAPARCRARLRANRLQNPLVRDAFLTHSTLVPPCPGAMEPPRDPRGPADPGNADPAAADPVPADPLAGAPRVDGDGDGGSLDPADPASARAHAFPAPAYYSPPSLTAPTPQSTAAWPSPPAFSPLQPQHIPHLSHLPPPPLPFPASQRPPPGSGPAGAGATAAQGATSSTATPSDPFTLPPPEASSSVLMPPASRSRTSRTAPTARRRGPSPSGLALPIYMRNPKRGRARVFRDCVFCHHQNHIRRQTCEACGQKMPEGKRRKRTGRASGPRAGRTLPGNNVDDDDDDDDADDDEDDDDVVDDVVRNSRDADNNRGGKKGDPDAGDTAPLLHHTRS